MDENYLIKKWLTNSLSEEEWEAFKKLEDYDLHMKLDQRAKNFKASNFTSPADFESLKNKLESKPTTSHRFSTVKTFMRYAALLLVSLGIYFAFFNTNLTQVETLSGEKITAMLPDESEVMLNAVSKITFNEDNWDTKREINLTGEAYFEVAKGSLFDVLTDMGKVSVLGTQFNVKNREGYFEVVCYQGSVGVTYKDTFEKLKPGQVFRVFNGVVTTDSVSAAKPFWLQNESYFAAAPFYEVIQELERQYGVKVTAESVDMDRIFKGGFVHKDLDMALESITKPLGLVYIIETPNSVVLKNSE